MKKITVVLSREHVETLRRVSEKRGITMTEAFRRALAIEKFIDESTARGERILVAPPVG